MAEIPKKGFIKITVPEPVSVNPSDKAALVRKGNQFFNDGAFDMAKRVFLSVGYSDGLIRLGDHYYRQSDYFEAFRMYKNAPAPDKAAWMIEQMAGIVKEWLSR
ncbi:MAG: hypothetical protein B6D68_01345 [spirochete symbiont of Stewartia floridana]|nr:MAG: hypothetical protein B6D68_01345 [spirochete symbiont of Stewartia floridana]